MTTESRNKLMMLVVGLLVVVVALQSVVMFKLYQRSEVPAAGPAAEASIQMDLQPKAGSGQPPAGGSPGWDPLVPSLPFGGLGYNPGLWDPLQEFRSMRQQMDQMFNDSFGRFQQSPDFQSMWGGTSFSPSMDVEEKKGNYIVRMDIPGTDKSNISVNINDRELTVSGTVDEAIEEKDQHHLRKERRSGQFKRVLTLPGPVKADEMEAKYEKGVLTITVPRADEEQDRSRSIEIE